MSDVKQFGLKGVAEDLQLGRRGPRVKVVSGTVQFRNSDDSAYSNVEVADPTAPDHAATKRYVDAVASGLDLKSSVRVATTAALPNTPTYNNGTAGVGATLTASTLTALSPIDGVSLVTGDRILVKNQANAAHNGIYVVTDPGNTGTVAWVLTRATDADSSAEVTAGLFTFIEEGTVNDNRGFVLITNNPITIGTTSLDFTQFSDTGSADPMYRQDTVNFNDSSPKNISLPLPTNALLQRVKIRIATAWDDSNTTIAISNGVTTFMAANRSDLLNGSVIFEEGLLESTQIGANNQLQATITGGAPTQGQAIVHVAYVLG